MSRRFLSRRLVVRVVIAVVVASMAIVLIAATRHPTSDKILSNEGFEESSLNGISIARWSPDRGGGTDVQMIADAISHSGYASAMISSEQPIHARWSQSIVIAPHVKYYLSGWIKTSDVLVSKEQNQDGANIGWECFRNDKWHRNAHGLQGTNDWTQIQPFVVDPQDCETIDIVLQLGQFSGQTSGRVWFDDVTLTPISHPGGCR